MGRGGVGGGDPSSAALHQILVKARSRPLSPGLMLHGKGLSGEAEWPAPGPAARGGKGTGLGQ